MHLPGEDLLRFLQPMAGRDPNFRPIMKIGHNLEADIASRVGDHSYDRAYALLVAQLHDLFEVWCAGDVHGFQVCEICQESKTRS